MQVGSISENEHVNQITRRDSQDFCPPDAKGEMYEVASAQCQAFLEFALSDLGEDCMLLSFLPLPEHLLRQFPYRLLAPSPGGNVVDLTKVERLCKLRGVIVAVHIVGDIREKEAAYTILKQFCAFKKWITVLVAFVIPDDLQPSAEIGEAMLHFQDELMDMSIADDVIIDPETTAGYLEHCVRSMLKSHSNMIKRMAACLQREPTQANPQEVAELRTRLHNLLWEGMPNVLMPNFPRLDRTIYEDHHEVGQYRFIRRHACDVGCVLQATTADGTPVAVKVITKSAIDTPDEIELINREIIFLNGGSIVHPNIAKGRGCLHTENYVYLISDHHGDKNLEQHCAAHPNRCVPEVEALDCLMQLAAALAYLHNLHIAHRSISLHHVVVKKRADTCLHYTLIDFRSMVRVKGDMRSNAICGSLPCMPPEVVSEEGYIPRYMDRWSLGVLLLEIAGGLGSLSTCSGVNFREAEVLDSIQSVTYFFRSVEDCHCKALAAINGVNHPEVIEYLHALLSLDPSKRMSMSDLYHTFETRAETEVASPPCNPEQQAYGRSD